MIGQKNLLNELTTLKERFPRFLILTGDKGCGKKTICKELCKQLGYNSYEYGLKIDNIRKMLEASYLQATPTIFYLFDADNMSITAKNALLKITEEPPKNAYFIMTLESVENTLPTIKSRGVHFSLDPYTKDEVMEYRRLRNYPDTYDDIIEKICNTTGEVDDLFANDIQNFYITAKAFVDCVFTLNGGMVFKFTQILKIKDTDTGFNPVLFVKTVRLLLLLKYKETKDVRYLRALKGIGESIKDLQNPSINKLGTLDTFVLYMRAYYNAG